MVSWRRLDGRLFTASMIPCVGSLGLLGGGPTFLFALFRCVGVRFLGDVLDTLRGVLCAVTVCFEPVNEAGRFLCRHALFHPFYLLPGELAGACVGSSLAVIILYHIT